MADFKKAILFTRKREGGYVNDPSDDGGETYCGISRKENPTWKGWPIVDAHKPLKWNAIIEDSQLDDMVNDFYYKVYWLPLLLDRVNNDNVAGFVFDWHVMSGIVPIKVLQRLVGVNDDGVIGAATVAAINSSPDTLFERIKTERIQFYKNLVLVRPNDQKFLGGWLARINDFEIS